MIFVIIVFLSFSLFFFLLNCRFLLKELIACECVELALIVATVTLELSVLNFLLAKHPHYLKQFLQMLQVQPGAYQQLRQLVRNPNQH